MPLYGGGGGVTWPLTNTADETFQPNSIANTALTIHNNASAVNGVTHTGTATGSNPTLTFTGDANQALTITNAGTGSTNITAGGVTGVPLTLNGAGTTQTGDLLDILQNSGGNALFKFATVSAGANGLTFTASAGSGAVTMAVAGTGTNVGLTLNQKGTAALLVGASGNPAVTVGNTNSSTTATLKCGATQVIALYPNASFGLDVQGVTNGNNGVRVTQSINGAAPSITVVAGSDSNADLTIGGLGTGVINYGYAGAAISGSVGPATLATTTGGATGPATATQNQWLKVKVNGTVNYIPVWQ